VENVIFINLLLFIIIYYLYFFLTFNTNSRHSTKCHEWIPFWHFDGTFPENKRRAFITIDMRAIRYIFLHKTLSVCWKFACSLFSSFVAIFREKRNHQSRAPSLVRSHAWAIRRKMNFHPYRSRWRVLHEKWPSWRIDGRIRSVISNNGLPFSLARFMRFWEMAEASQAIVASKFCLF